MVVNTVLFGDCRTTMRQLIADGVKVQLCVTSPPYWGLRDYGHAGQIGLEPTPEQYVANMVEVFGLVRELLSDDGTLWLNLGDSYAAGGSGGASSRSTLKNDGRPVYGARAQEVALNADAFTRRPPPGLKPKDLVGIPWRVAFALQADGWYLRQDIIWSKPNPMPESVTDRCTKAHEYLFLLSKGPRYHFDADAIAEKSESGIIRDRVRPNGLGTDQEKAGSYGFSSCGISETRNKRSVWTVTTQPYAEAHFATFPPKLIEPCILAGSRPGDVVLDPFMGSGTTGEVSSNLGRDWLGCELNEDYGRLQKARTAQQGIVF